MTDRFRIEESGAYLRSLILKLDPGDSFEELLDRCVPEPAHVFVISPAVFFRSPSPERIGYRKLVVMPCNSTPTSEEAIRHFLDVIERTDPVEQQTYAERFLAAVEASQQIRFVDRRWGTEAVFEHRDGRYEWNQQAGPLDWGEQQIAPAGEISVLPAEIMRFDPSLRLAVDGDVALRGQPVLHAGLSSYLREDQARIYAVLESLRDHAVIVTVRGGLIRRVRASHSDAQPAADMLEALFQVDSRYETIWEIGFGINLASQFPLRGNHAMNEVFGSPDGVLHWGLGLTPYTQYALILPSLDTDVVNAGGAAILGAAVPESKPRMRRRIVGGCVCHS